jgi:hypothetical protein
MRSLVAIGLPETGKTTFLAALWHVTEREEVPGSLRLEKISENAKHLNSIKNDWLSFKRVVRTVPGQEQSATLWLREESGVIGEVVFPDLSGESFQGAWEERHWTKEYNQLIADAGSLLLFIHPGTLREPYTIAEMQKMAEAAFPEENENNDAVIENVEEEDKQAPEAVEEWDPEKAPTQVQLVELLQFADHCIKADRPVRIAVIISAWDLVKNDYPGYAGPKKWLEDRTSYLDQYLKSNFEQFKVRVYGVSAQGGDLKADRELLLSFEHASDRILIEGPDCSPHDISEPIRWCLGLRDGTD